MNFYEQFSLTSAMASLSSMPEAQRAWLSPQRICILYCNRLFYL